MVAEPKPVASLGSCATATFDGDPKSGLLSLRCFRCIPYLSQESIAYWMLLAQAVGTLVLFLLRLVSPILAEVSTPLAVTALVVNGALPFAYRSHVRHIRMVATLAYALLVGLTVPDSHVQAHVCATFPLPLIVAMVLRGTCCMTIAVLTEYLVLVVRAKGQGYLVLPETITILAMVSGGLILVRTSMDSALHEANLSRQEAERKAAEVKVAYDTTIVGWSRALELRDSETQGHSARVTDLTLLLAQELRIPESQWDELRWGALLHDIGKMGVPDAILRKPGPLTPEERSVMQEHARIGRELLAEVSFLQKAIDIPYCHHERWDGEGYPQGLRGEQIPLSARLFAVVDVWDALTSDRPYRAAWSPEKALAYLQEEAGKAFDPVMVQAFVRLKHLAVSG